MHAQPPQLLEMIRDLIAIPSVSSVTPHLDQSNRRVIDLLADWLADLDFTVEIQVLADDPTKANLIATLGTGPGGLILSGHTDTVPYDDGLWRHDPFGGIIADERLYGLGSADMKSFLALAIEAVRRLDRRQLRQPLIILATADEESSMRGARALVGAQRHLGRFAVIGEPTNLRPVRLHKGIMMEAIRLQGRSGHSSNPALGLSALDGMYKIMGSGAGSCKPGIIILCLKLLFPRSTWATSTAVTTPTGSAVAASCTSICALYPAWPLRNYAPPCSNACIERLGIAD